MLSQNLSKFSASTQDGDNGNISGLKAQNTVRSQAASLLSGFETLSFANPTQQPLKINQNSSSNDTNKMLLDMKFDGVDLVLSLAFIENNYGELKLFKFLITCFLY